MTDALQRLIASANAEAMPVYACTDGSHHWQSEGGRSCPVDSEDEDDGPVDLCSQAVYRCAICGVYDYGERGGPGFNDCATTCRHGHREAFA